MARKQEVTKEENKEINRERQQKKERKQLKNNQVRWIKTIALNFLKKTLNKRINN